MPSFPLVRAPCIASRDLRLFGGTSQVHPDKITILDSFCVPFMALNVSVYISGS